MLFEVEKGIRQVKPCRPVNTQQNFPYDYAKVDKLVVVHMGIAGGADMFVFGIGGCLNAGRLAVEALGKVLNTFLTLLSHFLLRKYLNFSLEFESNLIYKLWNPDIPEVKNSVQVELESCW